MLKEIEGGERNWFRLFKDAEAHLRADVDNYHLCPNLISGITLPTSIETFH